MYTITKLPESGDLYGNITSFGVAEGSRARRTKVIHRHPKGSNITYTDLQTKVVLF